MKILRSIFPVIACMALVSLQAGAQQGTVKQVKLTRFELQSSQLVKAAGEQISQAGYRSDVYWFPVNVPSTVLNALVVNKVYPDPYQGLNNMYIPDASDEFNKKYDLEKYSHLPGEPNPWKKPYWYRTVFDVPASDAGRHFQLIFKGINYRAAVWVNGRQVADSVRMSGMFAQYSLDVSRLIDAGKPNALAVKIYPLDYPGLPSDEQLKALDDFYPNGGPTGDIGKNVTMLCSAGWDWIPPVRDRNMGIWLPVYLRTSGGVTFKDPKIVASLPDLPDTTKAIVSLNLDLVNHGKTEENGKLSVTIAPENFAGAAIKFSRSYAIPAAGAVKVALDGKSVSELNLSNPALWWPNGYGKPNLYRIRLQYSSGTVLQNDTSFVFGVRTVSTRAVEVGKSWRRDFYVNDRRIHITGGAWVPDMMLNRDSARYDWEMRLCRNSNINLVRIWGGGVTPCDEFWDAADRYGLLVWSDFWVTGDTQGEFKGSPDWPLDGEIFKKNVLSTIFRIRNHPSLLVWTGGNEGHARKELYDFMRNSIIGYDGTRPFIPSSSGFARLPEGWAMAWPDNKPTGVYSGGPYTWQDPLVYYKKAIAGGDWVFKDETGIPSQPPYNILPKIITNLVWDRKAPFPMNNIWGYHDAATGNGRYDLYYNEMVKRYGAPSTMEDFSDKMQLMNAVGYQGIFEAAAHKLNDIGGVMLWKLNAAFPSVVWQVYDWYLMPNAGYYFMQNACEPLHIQLNPVTKTVQVVNKKYEYGQGLKALAEVYSVESQQLFREETEVIPGAPGVADGPSLAKALEGKGVKLVLLKLKDQRGRTVSRNTYWLSPDNDYTDLNGMLHTKVGARILKTETGKNDKTWTIQISNQTQKVAFFVRSQLLENGDEILPSWWSGNYVTLGPSDQVLIRVSCPLTPLHGKAPVLRLAGWNTDSYTLPLN